MSLFHSVAYWEFYFSQGFSPYCIEEVETDRKIQQRCSPSLTLNDENRFVVDLIPFSNLYAMFVTFFGALQQRIADLSC